MFQHHLFVFNIRPTRRMNVSHFRIKRNDISAFTQPQATHKLLSFLELCAHFAIVELRAFTICFILTRFCSKISRQIWLTTGFSRRRN